MWHNTKKWPVWPSLYVEPGQYPLGRVTALQQAALRAQQEAERMQQEREMEEARSQQEINAQFMSTRLVIWLVAIGDQVAPWLFMWQSP